MPKQTAYEEFRKSIVKALMDEIHGPEPSDSDERQAEVLTVSPLQQYATGVLFPQGSHTDDLDEGNGGSGNPDEEAQPERPKIRKRDIEAASDDASAVEPAEETPLTLANQFNPAAIGVTVRVKADAQIDAVVTAGTYEKKQIEKAHPRAGETMGDGRTVFPKTRIETQFHRRRLQERLTIKVASVDITGQYFPVPGTDEKLCVHVRSRSDGESNVLVSLALVNRHTSAPSKAPEVTEAFFQVALSLYGSDGSDIFLPVDRISGASDDFDTAALDLLYRERRAFGLGHGTGVVWDHASDPQGNAVTVRTTCVPTKEMKPVVPRESSFGKFGYNLLMKEMAEPSGDGSAQETILERLNDLAQDYALWIDSVAQRLQTLDDKFHEAAFRNIAACQTCLNRIKDGIRYLEEHADAMIAFRIANRAMHEQQVRSRLPELEPEDRFEDTIAGMHFENGSGPRWRPFQLAFILMNIACCADSDHPDREIVDLIWFPTGGGKTEAYLGLSAYCIALRRLRNASNTGIAVLMRYTLRLLAAQQFQRAAALIAVLDALREDRYLGADLGQAPITIGVWVGKSLSPNRRADAIEALTSLQVRDGAANPFQLLRCPWCRTAMDRRGHLGYKKERFLPEGENTVIFRCPNEGCRWHRREARLPVLVVDDDIYDAPPTLLVGTVDKFAQLAWEPRTGNLFGVGCSWRAPELIIQDELHLISGPLGTIVGLYETVISELCLANGGSPKIVASTATIREAEKQCRGLYARKPFTFPPAGLDAGDSYFAFEKKEIPGRLYVGVFGTAVRSHATAQVRVVSSLLQSVMPGDGDFDEEIADKYATVLWYFNSLRELGHALTMCTGDIPEHHFSICKRKGLDREQMRRFPNIAELTSRRTADEIPKILEDLGKPWRLSPEGAWAVDILLATNMISVGVDVSRLGLMVIAGQPKSTSEYIQVTGRVGREIPGLVVTVYNPARSRDRSLYEQFSAYHGAIYKYVEPTSVTPFSPRARTRAMAGVIISMVRLIAGADSPDQIVDLEDGILEIKRRLVSRMELVDPTEVEDAEREIDAIIDEWRAVDPPEWGKMAGTPDGPVLMVPYGSSFAYGGDGYEETALFPVLTSMRNVDASCVAKVLHTYPHPEE